MSYTYISLATRRITGNKVVLPPEFKEIFSKRNIFNSEIRLVPIINKDEKYMKCYDSVYSKICSEDLTKAKSAVIERDTLKLNKKLRDLVDIKDEVVFLGAGNYFELWNPEIYNSCYKKIDVNKSLEKIFNI